MWYDSFMPAVLPKDAMQAADAAVAFARQVRKFHARRTNVGSSQRRKDIDLALDRLRDAMLPLRSEIGRFPYGPQTVEAEHNREAIRCASQAIQCERRKLWKMAARKPKKTTRRK